MLAKGAIADNMSWLAPSLVLLSQARPTFARERKGLVNCIYKLCPATVYGVVWSRYSILSHDTLHRLSSNNGTELGQLFCYYRRCKNTSTILHRERAHFATGCIIWNLVKLPANWIPVGHGLYTQSTRPFPLLRKWVWLEKNNLPAFWRIWTKME